MITTILLDPHPRSLELLFTKEQQARLRSMAEIKLHEGERMPDEMVDRYIGAASVVVGQTSLPRERFERGIHVLGVGGAYAEAAAEISVGFALSLARGIAEHDRLFREGQEVYGRPSNSASLVDFDALTRQLQSGRFSAAIDVFPEEPFAPDHPVRSLSNVILSAHRGGGIRESYLSMGEMIMDDLTLILKGLAPVRLQKASRETVGRMQSKPVG